MESAIPHPIEVTRNAEVEDTGERPKKQQRVWAACSYCRGKKVKCDGQRPVCSPCIKRYGPSATCSWGSRKGRQGYSTQDSLRLKRQIHDSESAKTSSAIRVRTESPNLADEEGEPGFTVEGETESSVIKPFMSNGLISQIRRVIDQQSASPENKLPSSASMPEQRSSVMKNTNAKRGEILDYQLPSRQRADHLLECYWRQADSLYLFLERDETETAYRDLWTGKVTGEDTRLFICLLNVIFSIASVLDNTVKPKERVNQADMFYQRAKEMLKFDLILHQSILAVQCFLVFGQYLQSTEDPQECWVFVGLAIRIAQSLGLDIPSTSAFQDEKRKNLLRKVWHGCVLMDRTLSMNFGRPTMITTQAAAMVPYQDAHSDFSTCSCFIRCFKPESNASSDCHFFIESLKLYELMDATLLLMYSSWNEEASSNDIYAAYFGAGGAVAAGSIMEVDSKLSSWFGNLPIHLGRDANVQRAPTHVRQSDVLWLRYCHLRILLFRPVMSRLCCKVDNGSEAESIRSAMPWKMAFNCSVACVKTALDTVEFFRVTLRNRAQEELDDLLPAWWYSILYIYTAATVLVAARLDVALLEEITEATISRAWDTVVDTFKYLGTFNKHARRCAATVNILYHQIPQQHRRQNQGSQQYSNPGGQNVDTHLQSKSQQQRDPGGSQSRDVMGGSHTTTTTRLPPSVLCDDEDTNFGTESRESESQPWPASQPFPTAADAYISDMDYLNAFDVSNLQLDPGDMSWLNSAPFQLYSSL